MDILDSICQEINDLICRICNTCLLHCRRIVPEAVYDCLKSCRKNGSGKLTDPLHLAPVGYRHNSRKYRNRDSRFPDSVKEIIVDGIVKEHLCRQEINSTVHFFFQITDVILFMCIFYVSFRIACSSDTEISMLFDLLYQFRCMFEGIISR